MLLLDYLNKNFPTSGTWSVDELITYFMETFGVSVKNEKDLYLFKYDMILAKWLEPLVRECRGTILRKGTSWEICSSPFSKFFNQSEGHSGIHSEELFAAWVNTDPYLMQKVDGTCIQLWYDKYRKRWVASTLGTITPGKVNDYDFTFADLFWKILRDVDKINHNFLDSELTHDCTFIFELCTVYNRILTKYPNDRIYLLAVRNNQTGVYWNSEQLQATAENLAVMLPATYTFMQLGLTNLASTSKFIEDAAKDNEKYGEYSEGFVGYKNGVPVAKFKNNTYLSLHHLSGGDTAHTKNVVIEAFFTASIDDMMKVLTPPMIEFVEKLRQWYIKKSAEITVEAQAIAEGTYADQKAYALRVQKIVDKGLMSLFFAFKEKILSKSFTQDDINDFFKKSWGKYEDVIKSL